ncbi:MAG: hypothetical protein ACP5VS_16865 [Desulfomonilaceae bacterium]
MAGVGILKNIKLFPERRFDNDFSFVFWLAGLWFYLKTFLYFCYLYMLGLDPTPYSSAAKFEIFYFAVALIPAFVLGVAFWNEKAKALFFGIIYLVIDTPILGFHVLRMADQGYLDSGLTQFFEIGSLALNVIVLGSLIGTRSTPKSDPAKPKKSK